MTRIPGEGLPELNKSVEQAMKQLRFSTPEFRLTIGWASTYDDLFAGSIEMTEEDSVLDVALKKGRCIVTGRGGGGKTQMLHRIMRTASERGVVAVLVDLKDWTKPDYSTWTDWTKSDIGSGASFLLERFSQPRVDALSLDYLPPSTQKLLIVDGLNEIIAPVGQQILLALDEFAGDQIGLSVLVADRLTRRSLPSPTRWALATVLPIAMEIIVQYCSEDVLRSSSADSLATPYFLDAAIQKQTVAERPSETHRRFLHDHGGLEDAELDTVAGAAYRLYQDSGTRTFPVRLLIDMVGDELTARLLQNGVLVPVDQGVGAQFAHHLLHDYLAARHVSTLAPDAWTRDLLRTISFDGGSFDTISLVLSLLTKEKADAFLRRLYDWNPYAAAYALSDMDDSSSGPSLEMQRVIFAMLAEKRFDIVEPTRQRATDALAIINARSAAEIKTSKTMRELSAALGAAKSDEAWFDDWVSLYTRASELQVSDADLERIRHEDSIVGWTVANVARRMQLSDVQLTSLRSWLLEDGAVVRWRIAHVLGAHPSIESAVALAELLGNDVDSDVKYGAVRSLVETAARTKNDELRSSVVKLLTEIAPTLISQKKVKDELKRALCVVPGEAPESWFEVVAAVCKSVYVAEDEPTEREGWRRYIEAAAVRYSRD